MDFSKELTKSEAKYKLVRLPKKILDAEFPKNNELFNVNFKGKNYKLKVNTSEQIMISQLFEKYRFQRGEILKIKSVKEGFEFLVGN